MWAGKEGDASLTGVGGIDEARIRRLDAALVDKWRYVSFVIEA